MIIIVKYYIFLKKNLMTELNDNNSNRKKINNVITNNINGYLFEPKNIKELILKLLKALNLPHSKIVQIQENNIKKTRNIYSWETIVNKIIKIYQE